MERHEVISRDKWLAARKQHLTKEKEFTRLRDQLSAERRNLPGSGLKNDMFLTDQTARRRSPTFSTDAAN